MSGKKRHKHYRVWHYTVGVRLNEILNSKEIRPTTVGLPDTERPAVWFSTNSVWEETANKGITIETTGEYKALTREETHRSCGGLARIEVRPEAAPYAMDGHKRLSGITREGWKKLIQTGRDLGAEPREWRVSFRPVPLEQWLTVEVWDGEG